ncbi:MAG: DUF488 domain-containing protein [Dehalococcoidia bacterium]
MSLYTIGFTKTSAESFFGRLQRAGVRRVIDVRLNNVSQLAGFAKRDDLRYFLAEIGGIGYEHRLDLAPTPVVLDAYRKEHSGFATFEQSFLALITERKVETVFSREDLEGACLLCSEASAEHCHRRVAAEYLQHHLGGFEIVHL